MDCLFSAQVKGKGTCTVFCISHYRTCWHTPSCVPGACVWAWGFGVSGRGFHYWDTQKTEISLPLNCGCFPPEQPASKLELWGWSPQPPLPREQLCARSEAELNSKQYSARFCWPAAKPALYCHCQSEITGFSWTHPFKPQERSGLVLVCLEIKQEVLLLGLVTA